MAMAGRSSEEISAVVGLVPAATALRLGRGFPGLGFSAGVVLGKQALERLLTCGRADRVANAVILGKGLTSHEGVFNGRRTLWDPKPSPAFRLGISATGARCQRV